MDVGKKSVATLAMELAKGWKHQLRINQQLMLAEEVEDLVDAVLIRERQKGWEEALGIGQVKDN